MVSCGNMNRVFTRIGFVALFLVSLLLSACGGGGGAASSDSLVQSEAKGPTSGATLRISPDVPELVVQGSSQSYRVYSLDASGKEVDVTTQVNISFEKGDALVNEAGSDGLQVRYPIHRGPNVLLVHYGGQTLSKPVWITQLAGVPVSSLFISVGDGYSGMEKNPETKRFVTVPSRALMIQVYARWPGNQLDINEDVVVTSSDSEVLSVTPVINTDGSVPWFVGKALRAGLVTLTARVGSRYSVSESILVSPAAVFMGFDATPIAITENSNGRNTAFVLGSNGPNSISDRATYFSWSDRGNNWADPIPLSSPVGLNIPSVVRAVESSTGYRAVVTVSSVGRAWLNVITPNNISGPPIELANELGVMGSVIGLDVGDDGTVNAWLFKPGTGVRRVRVSSGASIAKVVNQLSMPDISLPEAVSVSIDKRGSVGVLWSKDNCTLHFAFDTIAEVVPVGLGTVGEVKLAGCAAEYFVFGGRTVAIGSNGLGVIARVASGFNNTDVWFVSIPFRGVVTVEKLDSDTGDVASTIPQIVADSDGGMLAFWETQTRGIWAVHQSVERILGDKFMVEQGQSGLFRPTVYKGYSYAAGKYVLSWMSGDAPAGFQFKQYSVSEGLSEKRLIVLPFFVNRPELLFTDNGLSVLWGFAEDDFSERSVAIQGLTQ